MCINQQKYEYFFIYANCFLTFTPCLDYRKEWFFIE